MIRIGGVSIDVSHPKAFSLALEQENMDMHYDYIHNPGFRTRTEVEWFKNRFAVKAIADSLEEMAPLVDVGFIQSCNWDKHLDQAMPFLRAGKPVFIDKPIVGSMADVARLRKLVTEGAKIMGASCIRYTHEVQEFLAMDSQERGDVLTVFGTCGVDEFNYSIHIVETICELAGAKAIECQFLGEASSAGGHRCQSYCITYENNVQGIYSTCLDCWQPFVITILTTQKTFCFEIDLSKMYPALLGEIYKELTTGKSAMADVEKLINSTEIMLCGKKSRDERGGQPVNINELTPEDRFDGYAFEREYARTAGKVYQD